MKLFDFSFLVDENIHPEFTTATIEALIRSNVEVETPFIVTAVRRDKTVHTRVRQLKT